MDDSIKHQAEEITNYFISKFNQDDLVDNKRYKELVKEVYFMITTS